MRVFKTRTFDRWTKRQALSGSDLRRAVMEMQRGLIDAQLGSGIFKKRISRLGHGKRGGFRTLIATNFQDRWFFLFGFVKNERSNIDASELRMLKRIASAFLGMDHAKVEEAIVRGELVELENGK